MIEREKGEGEGEREGGSDGEEGQRGREREREREKRDSVEQLTKLMLKTILTFLEHTSQQQKNINSFCRIQDYALSLLPFKSTLSYIAIMESRTSPYDYVLSVYCLAMFIFFLKDFISLMYSWSPGLVKTCGYCFEKVDHS